MEKYFSGEEFTDEKFNKGLSAGIGEGDIVPVITCFVLEGTGIKELLQTFIMISRLL